MSRTALAHSQQRWTCASRAAAAAATATASRAQFELKRSEEKRENVTSRCCCPYTTVFLLFLFLSLSLSQCFWSFSYFTISLSLSLTHLQVPPVVITNSTGAIKNISFSFSFLVHFSESVGKGALCSQRERSLDATRCDAMRWLLTDDGATTYVERPLRLAEC